jgi:hypothetical protein
MQRWDIINHLIKENNYKNYLEIGYYKGWSFDQIRCQLKEAADPNPCKDDKQVAAEYGWGIGVEDGLIFKSTSDDFFLTRIERTNRNMVFDIVFIDGLHEATQVERDIYNSLKHLSEGGTIVLHDMLPPTLEHATTGDKYGNWNGDCYKALLAFIRDDIFGNYVVRIVDTDWGCGIIQRSDIPVERMEGMHNYNRAIEQFDYFFENKDKLFEIITPEEFLTLYSKDK